MATDTPCFLPCTACGKIAAVARPPKLTGLARAAVEMQMGELCDDVREPLNVGKGQGTMFGIPANEAAAMLKLECGACYKSRTERATT